MKTAATILSALLVGLASAAASDWFSDHDTGAVMIPAGLTPLYDKPVTGGLPAAYCEPSDTCRAESTAVDSSGAAWVLVSCSSNSGWARKTTMAPPQSREEGPVPAGGSRRIDTDSKRRYRILEKHPDWPRRIVKAVREGKICLDMSAEQLAVAWGEPSQKSPAFVLGVGSQELWLYTSGNGLSLIVFLVKGRVVGWSE